MDVQKIIDSLEYNAKTFEHLLTGLSEREYRWRPKAKNWNLLEIVCHLWDEELLDFRARTKHALFTPEEKGPFIDPEGRVISENYAGQDYEKMLAKLLDERVASVAWLRNLENPDWNSAWKHPRLGDLSAGFFLANWLAHDYLHIRQIIKLKYDFLSSELSDADMRYAGEW